jgi:hypothetical protein
MVMSAVPEQPPWSPWLLRALLKGVAAGCGVLSAGCLIFFFWSLALTARNPFLIPITLLLLPVALGVILLGCPLWGLAAACGLKLHQLEGVYAQVGANGLQLRSASKADPRQVAWGALEEVVKIHHPLCEPYLFKLKDGSEVRVDFVDEGLLARRLEGQGTRFHEVWGSQGGANRGG